MLEIFSQNSLNVNYFLFLELLTISIYIVQEKFEFIQKNKMQNLENKIGKLEKALFKLC